MLDGAWIELLMLLSAMSTWPIVRCPDALWTLALDRASMFETCGSNGHQLVLHIEAPLVNMDICTVYSWKGALYSLPSYFPTGQEDIHHVEHNSYLR